MVIMIYSLLDAFTLFKAILGGKAITSIILDLKLVFIYFYFFVWIKFSRPGKLVGSTRFGFDSFEFG